MRTLWIYIIVLVLFCASGLTVGAKNSSMVTFDFLLFRAEISLAMVMVTGIVIGVLFGVYLSLLFSCRAWARTLRAQAEIRRLTRAQEAAADVSTDQEGKSLSEAAKS